jgi:hypothetical protein
MEMAGKYWIGIGFLTLVFAALFSYVAVGHQTPAGQRQLFAITPQSLPQFAQQFNNSANAERIVVLLSPTCPVCLEGSSRINAILQRHPGSNLRVFAIWEPMLPTDWSQPNSQVLARLSDIRVIQLWDEDHLIAKLMEKGAAGREPACCRRRGAWWDVVAVYPPQAQWTGSAPVPEMLNGTVVRTAEELEVLLRQHS